MQPQPIQNSQLQHAQGEQQQPEIKNLNHLSLYYTYIQRYYTTYESQTMFVHMHSNGLFLIRPKLTALPSRPLSIKGTVEVNEVKGKKKKGGLKVRYDTIIAEILCEGGTVFGVKACVEGTILEGNFGVKVEDLDQDGSYLAIIEPSRRFVPKQANMKKINYQGNPMAAWQVKAL